MSEHTTSPSLLERLRRPADQEAWSRFVRLYTPLVFHWACRMGLQGSDAADLAQEVFALLVQKLPQFVYDPGKSFRAWLRTVVVNKWRERLRVRSGPDARGEDLPEPVAPDDADALAEVEFHQHLLARTLEIMQTEFQPLTWKACWEHKVCGRRAAEVAQELGLTVNAVYLCSSRVLRRVRQELSGLLD